MPCVTITNLCKVAQLPQSLKIEGDSKKLSQSPMSRARRRIQIRAQASCSRPIAFPTLLCYISTMRKPSLNVMTGNGIEGL